MVQYIADWVVDDADAVNVDERERADRVVVRLEVAQEDMGRVIGKEGRIVIRPSGTEPVIRVMVQHTAAATAKSLVQQLADEISAL